MRAMGPIRATPRPRFFELILWLDTRLHVGAIFLRHRRRGRRRAVDEWWGGSYRWRGYGVGGLRRPRLNKKMKLRSERDDVNTLSCPTVAADKDPAMRAKASEAAFARWMVRWDSCVRRWARAGRSVRKEGAEEVHDLCYSSSGHRLPPAIPPLDKYHQHDTHTHCTLCVLWSYMGCAPGKQLMGGRECFNPLRGGG